LRRTNLATIRRSADGGLIFQKLKINNLNITVLILKLNKKPLHHQNIGWSKKSKNSKNFKLTSAGNCNNVAKNSFNTSFSFAVDAVDDEFSSLFAIPMWAVDEIKIKIPINFRNIFPNLKSEPISQKNRNEYTEINCFQILITEIVAKKRTHGCCPKKSSRKKSGVTITSEDRFAKNSKFCLAHIKGNDSQAKIYAKQKEGNSKFEIYIIQNRFSYSNWLKNCNVLHLNFISKGIFANILKSTII
jgi:hypothetical protein